MGVKLANNASSTLAANVAANAVAFAIVAGDANKFPVLAAGDWFPLTIVDAAGNMEVVKVTARNNASLTVTRGQEGTTARAFTAGSRCDLRLTAGALAGVMDDLKGTLGALASLNIVPVERGGTGAATPEEARTALQLAAVASSGKADDLVGTLSDARLPSKMSAKTFTAASVFEAELTVGSANGGGIEVGRQNGVAASAFIDFHTSKTLVDYNSRIIATGDTALGLGAVNVISGTFTHNGDAIWDAGNMAQISLDEAKAGTGNTVRAWTSALVAAAAKAVVDVSPTGLGPGQQWTTLSRSYNTSYQNTTGRDVYLMLTVYEENPIVRRLLVSMDNATWTEAGRVAQSTATFHRILKPNEYARMEQCVIRQWMELRS